MKPVDFDYLRPDSLDEVCRLLAAQPEDIKILAGGQTLVPLLAMRLARPALILDINWIAALQGIAAEDGCLVIKACTRQAAALASTAVARDAPLLKKALHHVGHVQTRNRGTIGGSLANADPAAEIGIAALALDAEIAARSAQSARRIAITEFFEAPMVTALRPEELLTEIRLPHWREAGMLGTGFHEVSVRHSDFALAAAAAQLVFDSSGVCRRIAISLGGAGATPMRLPEAEGALQGTRVEGNEIAAAARIASTAIEVITDPHASPQYRRRIAGTVVARALAEAKQEALAGRG